jgi:hypothetical protein
MQKEKELKDADSNILGAEESIEKEKAKIDREIKEKFQEEEEIENFYLKARDARNLKRKQMEAKFDEEEFEEKKEEKVKKEKEL